MGLGEIGWDLIIYRVNRCEVVEVHDATRHMQRQDVTLVAMRVL